MCNDYLRLLCYDTLYTRGKETFKQGNDRVTIEHTVKPEVKDG
jgi:hypothetical protein